MENNVRARWDDRRFPAPWMAMTGCALMQFSATVFMTAVLYVGRFISEEFFLRAASTATFGGLMMNYVFSQFFALLLVVLVLLTAARKDFLTTVRLKKGIDGVQVLLLLVMCLGGFFLAQSMNGRFLEALKTLIGPPAEREQPLADTPARLLFELVIVAGLPAVCEELFYRGMVLRAYERYSRTAAVLWSAAAFAVMHGNLEQLMYAFTVGAVMALVTVKADSLFAGSLVHFTFNAISVILSYPPVFAAYERLFEYTVPAMAVSVMVPMLFAGGFVGYWLYSSRKNRRLYGEATVSDMACPGAMPKSRPWQKLLFFAAWTVFLAVNVYSMWTLWVGRAA